VQRRQHLLGELLGEAVAGRLKLLAQGHVRNPERINKASSPE
jgi:hypothetical protein